MQTLDKIFSNNAWAITVQLVGILVLIANLWLVSKLAPLAQDSALATQRINAHEVRITATEQAVIKMSDGVSEIKSDTSYLRGMFENRSQAPGGNF